MSRNMGAANRVVRAFVVAGIMVASAATAVCPTSILIGISTRPHGLHRVGRRVSHGHA